jgi:hypothetical protein
MTDFDPEKFEDKYEHYFTELQQAYKQAFDSMSERHESGLVHAVDQYVLAESEPFYEGDGQFRIELPDDAVERVLGEVELSGAELESVYEEYTDEIERQLRAVFDLGPA